MSPAVDLELVLPLACLFEQHRHTTLRVLRVLLARLTGLRSLLPMVPMSHHLTRYRRYPSLEVCGTSKPFAAVAEAAIAAECAVGFASPGLL